MRQPVVWLLALSVVTASLISLNQCPHPGQIVFAGQGMATDGHANLWHNGAGGKLFPNFLIWRSHARMPAAGLWRSGQVYQEEVLPHTSAAITPATPPPRRLT